MTLTRKHFKVDDIYDFSIKVLEAAGYGRTQAESTAYALLDSDKRGIFSHGTAGGTGLEEAVKRSGITSTVQLDSEPKYLIQKYPTIAIMDANGAPGHYTSDLAVEKVKELAREFGYGKVIVYNANHYGAAGVWSRKIASDGDLKGISTCTTVAAARVMGDDPNRLDYTKGAGVSLRVGTNPLAISIPHQDGIVTFDTAWTRMAVSYCLKHLKSGKMMSIPEYIGDAEYKSTLDPKEFAESMHDLNNIKGTVFPHGSTLAGYKGDSMLRFIEMDNALGGGPIIKIDLGSSDKSRWISHTFEAQAIDVLYSAGDARKRIRSLMSDYEQNYFGKNSRWPGDRADMAEIYSESNGIPYDDSQVETLRRAAEYVGISFDLQTYQEKEFPEHLFNK